MECAQVYFHTPMAPSCLRLMQLQVQRSRLSTVRSTTRNQVTPETCIPSYSEDKEAAVSAFHRAYSESQPEGTRIPGLQEFAGSIWERKRRIPSQVYNDPLAHLFTEFDADNDGHLTAQEIADALRSNNVIITKEQVQVYIDCVDTNDNKTIELSEFPDLVFAMATADLNCSHKAPKTGPA